MPKVCNYYVTFRSNDTCEFCPIWQNESCKNIEEKPYDLDLLKNAGVTLLCVTGGEPLLREDLPDILRKAKELGFEVQLETNGILYPERAKLLAGLIDRLFFFLDYPFAEEHDRSRGVECFNQATQSIKLAKELGGRPIIKFTMTRDSVRYLPEMIELAEKLKVLVYLDPVSDFFGTQGFEKATLSYIRYYSKRENVLANLAGLNFVRSGGNNTFLPRCRARQTTITILPDGSRVSPCFFNQGGKQGREAVCSSCMRWPYLIPSFSSGIDKNFFLNLYSNYFNDKKELNA